VARVTATGTDPLVLPGRGRTVSWFQCHETPLQKRPSTFSRRLTSRRSRTTIRVAFRPVPAAVERDGIALRECGVRRAPSPAKSPPNETRSVNGGLSHPRPPNEPRPRFTKYRTMATIVNQRRDDDRCTLEACPCGRGSVIAWS
jgi:hypothetical protein